jgi:hypothetical protein
MRHGPGDSGFLGGNRESRANKRAGAAIDRRDRIYDGPVGLQMDMRAAIEEVNQARLARVQEMSGGVGRTQAGAIDARDERAAVAVADRATSTGANHAQDAPFNIELYEPEPEPDDA